jgi:hypothetical protein
LRDILEVPPEDADDSFSTSEPELALEGTDHHLLFIIVIKFASDSLFSHIEDISRQTFALSDELQQVGLRLSRMVQLLISG